MPRLLLVDDNPSIHKIAETLLTASDIALVCAASGAEALALVDRGEAFDVAMVDISMLGMDGWELLAQLRGREATALVPVAMMAGVLDVVDPEKLRNAPIQGFLKKPVELRDLADRVRHILEMPVLPPAPPPLPVAPPPPEARPLPPPFATSPGFQLADHPELLQRFQNRNEEDLLVLGPEDLLPEEPAAEAPVEPLEAWTAPDEPLGLDEPLDLEELDLESLKDLTSSPEPEAAAQPEPLGGAGDEPIELQDFTIEDALDLPPAAVTPDFVQQPPHVPSQALEVPDFELGDTDLPLPTAAAEAPAAPDLPDLFPREDEAPTAAAQAQAAPVDPDFPDWSDDSDSLLAELSSAPPPFEPDVTENLDVVSMALSALLEPGPTPFPMEPLPPEPEATEAEPALDLTPEPDAPFAPTPVPEPLPVPAAKVGGADPLAALLADPVLMDRLAKALVARLGDQVLREIAWEVIPDLAERIQRN